MCEFVGCDYCVLLTVNMLYHVQVMFIQLLNLLERYRKNSYINFTTICWYLWNCILVILDHSLVSVWWYQRLCNAILIAWWWAQECSKHVEAWNKTYCETNETDTYRCDDTRGCVTQFWPPDDEHMCSKHVEAWNKLIVKQKFCASSWLITDIYIYWDAARSAKRQKHIFVFRNFFPKNVTLMKIFWKIP